MEKDTIAAISTGMTNSGIGIVRISGPEAIEIADRIYKGKESLRNADSHTIRYGYHKGSERDGGRSTGDADASPSVRSQARIQWRSTATVELTW